jgi:murein tripeptide amidase MpaA
MSESKAVSPTSAEVEARIHALREKHSRLVKIAQPGLSAEGRPIWSVSVTDPAVPADRKEHVLVTGGQHGDEESGRLVALALLDWLVTPRAAETIRRQQIVVMPNVNPDGAEQDVHYHPNGAQINLDHAPSGPVCPEAKAVEAVARDLMPEVYVDLHARGYTGCGYDMVLQRGPIPPQPDRR